MSKFNYKTEEEVIIAAMHIMESKLSTNEYFKSVEETSRYFQFRLGHQEREIFCVMYLNNQHQMIVTEDIFFGTIDSANIYPREIVKAALRHNAAAVIFSHNHPSGITEPSEADKRTTARLVEALALVDIRVLDHIIVTESQTTSFAVKGLL